MIKESLKEYQINEEGQVVNYKSIKKQYPLRGFDLREMDEESQESNVYSLITNKSSRISQNQKQQIKSLITSATMSERSFDQFSNSQIKFQKQKNAQLNQQILQKKSSQKKKSQLIGFLVTLIVGIIVGVLVYKILTFVGPSLSKISIFNISTIKQVFNYTKTEL